MKYKKYNEQAIISIVLILTAILSINYFINPFNVFKQRLLPNSLVKSDSKIQERLTKPIGFKIDNREISAIFLGTSRVDLCIDKNDYKKISGKESENLAVGGISSDEMISMIDIAREIHPEIKEIFIGFDFESFHRINNLNDNRAEITKNKKLEFSEINAVLLSCKTTGTSIWTIIKNIFSIKKRTYYSSGVKYIFFNKKISKEFQNTINEYQIKYSTYQFDNDKFNSFISYLKLLQSKGIKIKIFIMPTHITLQKVRYNCNLTEEYNHIRNLLVQDFEIYDFNYPNEYTKEKINPNMIYFFDGSHATHNLSKLIVSDILSDNPSLARKITKENVTEMNMLLLKELENCEDINVI